MQRSLSLLALAVLGCCAGVAAEESPRGERAERGRELLAQYQCGACHTIPGVRAARGLVGPPLTAWSRRSYVAGRVPNRPELLARWIAAPQSLVPGTSMPSMGVAPPEAEAMAAYLFTLK